MALCVLALLLTGRHTLTADDDAELTDRVAQAFEYYLEHPYLELDPTFVERFVSGDPKADAFRAMIEAYRSAAGAPPTAAIRSAEQRELDARVADALRGLAQHPLARWGLVPDRMTLRGLFAHMFLHAGWIHLLGNLLILYLAGPFIEDVWGRALFLVFYLLSGVAAAMTHVVLDPDSVVPMIGASGAIAGVMGAFLVRYRTTRIRFFYMFGFFVRGTFSAPAWLMLPLWFVMQVFFALMTRDVADHGGVAYGAHIGGFVFGVAVAGLFAAFSLEERFIARGLENKTHTTLVSHDALDRALELHAAGQSERALELLSREAAEHRADPDVALALWTVASEVGREGEAAPEMLAALRGLLVDGESEHAVRLWEELAPHLDAVKTDLPLLLRVIPALSTHDRPELARAALRRALIEAGTRPGAGRALKIAQLAEGCDPSLARAATRLALGQPDIDERSEADARHLLDRLKPGLAVASVADASRSPAVTISLEVPDERPR
jgi:membrane associated rhomboid family serine protease